MSRLSDYDRRIKQYAAAEETAGVLQDVNALKMLAIRTRFEKNQAFFDELRAVYGLVRAASEVETPNGVARTLYVALTSNRRFAGTLVRETLEALTKALAGDPDAAVLIVGRIGWLYFQAMGQGTRARQLSFVDEEPTREEIARLLAYTARFERVYVLHPRFESAFRQRVAMEDIAQRPEAAAEPDATYLFEPEVAAIRAFFDAQVRYILFERVLLESDLAKTAARFATMEESRERASELLKTERRKRMREMAAKSNAELLETFAGFEHWRTAGYE